MSEAKHTPIPWRLEYHPGHRGEPTTLIMRAGAEMWERWIAECPWGVDGDSDKDCDGKRDCTVAEAQANAAFIVRAVNSHDDLLAACKALVAYQESTDLDDEPADGEYGDGKLALLAARAAIAKAEGT